MPDLPASLTCAFTAEAGGLGNLSAAVDRLAEDGGWAPRDLVAVQVALDEVVSNVLKYAGLASDAQIRVDIRSEATLIEITVRDGGHPFDPLRNTVSAQPRTSGGVTIGGRGIGLVRQLMNELRYARDGEVNALTMVRHRVAAGQKGKE